MKTWNELKRENSSAALRDAQNAGFHMQHPEFLRKYEGKLLSLCVAAAKSEGIAIPGLDTRTGRVAFALALRDVREGDANYAAEFQREWAADVAAQTPAPPPRRAAAQAAAPVAPARSQAAVRPPANVVPLARPATASSTTPVKRLGKVSLADLRAAIVTLGRIENRKDLAAYQAAYNVFIASEPMTWGGNPITAAIAEAVQQRSGSAERLRVIAERAVQALDMADDGPEAA